jgi:hypothetical protein
MKHLLLFTFCIFTLLSCGKPRTIKVIAKNAVTGMPYAGLSYTIVSSRTAADGEKYKTEANGLLDANGEAITEIKQKKGRSYSVRIGKPNGEICFHNELHQYFDSPFDQNGTFTFKFAECAYLKRHIVNINCGGVADTMRLYTQHSILEYLNFNNSEWFHLGCANYQASSFSNVPMGNFIHKWIVTRNGNTETFYDTIYLNAGETRTYEINY